jgi:Superinfection immunity protein
LHEQKHHEQISGLVQSTGAMICTEEDGGESMYLMELVDRSRAYTGKHMYLRLFFWGLGITIGLFAFIILFIKSDEFSGLVVSAPVLLLGLFLLLVYFLPAIKAYQDKKPNKQAILALNIFLGWTLVGWVVALVWAFTQNDTRNAVAVATTPAILCSSCGKYSPGGAGFCARCGEKLPLS